MSHSISCPHCKATLTSPTPVPAGKSVKCPKCQQSFTTPAAEAEASPNYSITCVHCQAVLKSPTPVPPGKKVTCPKCKNAFTTPEPDKPAMKSPPANLNISIFTGDADAAIASLMDEAHGKPKPSDLVTEEDEEKPK